METLVVRKLRICKTPRCYAGKTVFFNVVSWLSLKKKKKWQRFALQLPRQGRLWFGWWMFLFTGCKAKDL